VNYLNLVITLVGFRDWVFGNITSIFVQVHFVFHYIFNEIGQIYHNENDQSFIERPIVTNR
jgi:hypothetical protein